MIRYFCVSPIYVIGNHFSNGKFQVENENCAILTEAIKRYGKIISSTIHSPLRRVKSHLRRVPIVVERSKWNDNELFDGVLDEVIVNLTQPCEEKPTENMKEKCLSTEISKRNERSCERLNYFL